MGLSLEEKHVLLLYLEAVQEMLQATTVEQRVKATKDMCALALELDSFREPRITHGPVQ